ncbi:UNVERIFIED_CONTAM: hypothetical protein HDU68_011840 [Siphonaria sp. JEL0065]|nr:hypothetical protein HDU68_011840 [Siphonaria sp. JEL0065]
MELEATKDALNNLRKKEDNTNARVFNDEEDDVEVHSAYRRLKAETIKKLRELRSQSVALTVSTRDSATDQETDVEHLGQKPFFQLTLTEEVEPGESSEMITMPANNTLLFHSLDPSWIQHPTETFDSALSKTEIQNESGNDPKDIKLLIAPAQVNTVEVQEEFTTDQFRQQTSSEKSSQEYLCNSNDLNAVFESQELSNSPATIPANEFSDIIETQQPMDPEEPRLVESLQSFEIYSGEDLQEQPQLKRLELRGVVILTIALTAMAYLITVTRSAINLKDVIHRATNIRVLEYSCHPWRVIRTIVKAEKIVLVPKPTATLAM